MGRRERERQEEKEMEGERERITKFQTPVLTVLSQTYVNLQNPFIMNCSGHMEPRPQALIDTWGSPFTCGTFWIHRGENILNLISALFSFEIRNNSEWMLKYGFQTTTKKTTESLKEKEKNSMQFSRTSLFLCRYPVFFFLAFGSHMRVHTHTPQHTHSYTSQINLVVDAVNPDECSAHKVCVWKPSIMEMSVRKEQKEPSLSVCVCVHCFGSWVLLVCKSI